MKNRTWRVASPIPSSIPKKRSCQCQREIGKPFENETPKFSCRSEAELEFREKSLDWWCILMCLDGICFHEIGLWFSPNIRESSRDFWVLPWGSLKRYWRRQIGFVCQRLVQALDDQGGGYEGNFYSTISNIIHQEIIHNLNSKKMYHALGCQKYQTINFHYSWCSR